MSLLSWLRLAFWKWKMKRTFESIIAKYGTDGLVKVLLTNGWTLKGIDSDGKRTFVSADGEGFIFVAEVEQAEVKEAS